MDLAGARSKPNMNVLAADHWLSHDFPSYIPTGEAPDA
jgi:hypothetical protein